MKKRNFSNVVIHAIALIITCMVFSLSSQDSQELKKKYEQSSISFEGPLKELGFEQESVDQNGRILGWLTIPQYQDSIYVRVTPHKAEYSIEYITPTSYKALKELPTALLFDRVFDGTVRNMTLNAPGLYYWRSQKKVKEKPTDKIYYLTVYREEAGEGGPWYKNTQFKKINAKLKLTSFGQYKKKEKDQYQHVRDLAKAFNGPYRFYITDQIVPVHFDKKQLSDYLSKTGLSNATEFWALEYKNIKNENGLVDFFLSLFPTDFTKTIYRWLDDKLNNSGLTNSEKEDIKKQYLFEEGARAIRFADTINILSMLDNIDRLAHCSTDQRKKMEQYLQERPGRAEQMTAVGRIECNPGLLQQD